MASTSTGFNKSLINRLMPTSSGQIEEFSSGCKLNMKANSEIEMESGSTFNVESGGSINYNSGAIVKFAVTAQSSLNKSVPRDGVSIIATTVVNTMTISGAPKAGMIKQIVSYSTLAQTIRAASAVGITFGATVNKFYNFAITNTTKTEKIGAIVTLVGHSTKRWHVQPRSSALITMSTACT